jgi:glycogen debranching enzyme
VNASLATNVDKITVIEHAAFAVSDGRGDIVPGTYHGLFVADTRFLSRCVLRLGGRRLERLSTGSPDHRRAVFHLTNQAIGRLLPNSVSVVRDRMIDDALHERIQLTSYATSPLRLQLTLHIGADFADIFEVLGRKPLDRSVISTPTGDGVLLVYERGDSQRSTQVTVDRAHTWARDRLSFTVDLQRGVPWEVDVRIESREVVPAAASRARRIPARRRIDPERVERWAARVPHLETDDPRLASSWRAAVSDMRALLLAEPGGSFIPAAGVPWFMAVFGRDASITALQTLIAGGDIAYGTLRELAAFQGRTDDPFRDEERGKIPHEVRRGELAALDRVPHARYYGSVDATPLYVRLFAEACRWNGWLVAPPSGTPDRWRITASGPMPPVLQRLLPAAERALAWIDRRASGPDGLIWYQRRTRTGIRNQVWKDSGDSYRFADGRMAQTPIAALEVQGYAVAAWRAMAQVFEALGRLADAEDRRARADAMVQRIDDAFWMPKAGTYAMGLDRYGHQIDSVTSNPGHLLWSGAVGPERASAVAERLLAPDMFTGWGVRTMSSEMAAFNPISYHNGSIWPHDNGIIAAGLARYGNDGAAWRIADAMLDAAVQDGAARLPELFGGFDRASTPELVEYPVACAPQAWATGAIFQMVQTLLGLEPAGASIRMAPSPLGPNLHLDELRIGGWFGNIDNRAGARSVSPLVAETPGPARLIERSSREP